MISSLLLLQPDFGMFIIISIIFFSQLFVSRINIVFFPILLLIFTAITIGSYVTIPHVKHRINNFFDKKVGDNFQVQKAMESFSRGKLYGVGPAEGKVKLNLPDAHTDFIFSVAGEEFGFALTFSIILLYFILIIHNILKFYKFNNEFILIAATGIIIHISAQILINISVNLHLLPTKGMTLPFISYGGSSMLSSGISIGILMAFSKKKYTIDFNKYSSVLN
jgi:cell division protein FtsW